MRQASKSWKQLNGSQKMGVFAEQSGSLIVVLVGGSIAALVLYATGSELFSEASPTKIFEDTTERVKASKEVRYQVLFSNVAFVPRLLTMLPTPGPTSSLPSSSHHTVSTVPTRQIECADNVVSHIN